MAGMQVAGMAERRGLDLIWLEITARCQLGCLHCYMDGGPRRSHGNMVRDDWFRVIDDARALGVRRLQFIGGEPTLHPHFLTLVSHAREDERTRVEVYSNLIKISPAMWELFEYAGVVLATSYYSPDAEQHDAITKRRQSHELTLSNIREAVRRNIPIHVGVIGVHPDQDVDGAIAELVKLGVTDVGVDYLRQVGRGVRDVGPGVEQLCGHCTSGRLAVTSSGQVYPCVFSRWLPVGNVLSASLADIDRAADGTRNYLASAFAGRMLEARCSPDNPCKPQLGPCKPEILCGPAQDPDGPNPR